MMLRKGFTLLEVVFGLLISSMIALILFQSLTQMNGTLTRVTALTSLERRVMLLQQQLETDFSGIFAPQLTERDDEDLEEEEKKKEKASQKEEKNKKEEDLQEEQDTGFKTFTFEADDRGFVKILSFVSCNPLNVYQQPSPRAVRVAYRVSADSENEGKLLLIRQESEELSLKKFEEATKKATIKEGQAPIRSYEIARNIENIKFEFYVEKIQKQEPEKKQPGQAQTPEPKKEEKKEEEEKPRAYFTLDEWKQLSKDEKKKYEKPEIPAYCSLKLFLNDDRKRVHSFEFLFFSAVGIAPVTIKGVTSLPSVHEMEQRRAGQQETDRMALHGGIPQYGRER